MRRHLPVPDGFHHLWKPIRDHKWFLVGERREVGRDTEGRQRELDGQWKEGNGGGGGEKERSDSLGPGTLVALIYLSILQINLFGRKGMLKKWLSS